MPKTALGPSAAAISNRSRTASLGKDNLLSVFELSVGPLALMFSLWALAYYFEGAIYSAYIILSILVFALTFPGHARLQSPIFSVFVNIVINWVWVAGLLLFASAAWAQSTRMFSPSTRGVLHVREHSCSPSV